MQQMMNRNFSQSFSAIPTSPPMYIAFLGWRNFNSKDAYVPIGNQNRFGSQAVRMLNAIIDADANDRIVVSLASSKLDQHLVIWKHSNWCGMV